MQAGNSIFALVMAYKGISLVAGCALKDFVVVWDQMECWKKVMVIPIGIPIAILPQIIATSLINKHMVSEKDIPPAYFD